MIVAEFDVDPSGNVRDVHVSPSGPFADALERHLKSCRYSPAMKDGRPAQEHITLSYSRLD
jgi:hypothetical protein